jgi:3-phosphoshikimate 1-carboxyvinyltransferase
MTRQTMTAFGADAGRYRAARYAVEPDATAASYFFAAAALWPGGRVRVLGLGDGSGQGDLSFVDVLRRMGAEVDRTSAWTEVRGGELRGLGEVSMVATPDVAQTLAVVAVFAGSPTTVTGIGFTRGHESDRLAAVVTELRRCGLDAEEHADGFTVHPGRPDPATVQTYGDHRMAMSFALLGLKVPGIKIADPGCVAKTFPGYFAALDQLR